MSINALFQQCQEPSSCASPITLPHKLKTDANHSPHQMVEIIGAKRLGYNT
jgi:hypothetical protein